jgi:hypothetical protein
MEGGVRCFKKNNGRIVLSVFVSDFIGRLGDRYSSDGWCENFQR